MARDCSCVSVQSSEQRNQWASNPLHQLLCIYLLLLWSTVCAACTILYRCSFKCCNEPSELSCMSCQLLKLLLVIFFSFTPYMQYTADCSENINLTYHIYHIMSQKYLVEGSNFNMSYSAVSRPSPLFYWLLSGDKLSDIGTVLRLVNIKMIQSD